MTERDLIEGCRSGDREAQRALYERTSERIYGILLRLTASPDDAFDLAQETYLKGFTQIEQFDGRSSIATWLYRIAVNEALQFLRRAKTMRAKLQELGMQQPSAGRSDEAGLRLDIAAALEAVPDSDRAMLLLRYQEGLDYRAIAEVVGCAEGTVASRLNRARERMRGILQKSYGHPEATDVGVHPNGGH